MVGYCVGSTLPLVHQRRKFADRGVSLSRHRAARLWHCIDRADRHRLGQRNPGHRLQTIYLASHHPHPGTFLAGDQRFDAAIGRRPGAGIFRRRILVGFFRRHRAEHSEQHSEPVDLLRLDFVLTSPLPDADRERRAALRSLNKVISIDNRRQKGSRRLVVKSHAHQRHGLIDA
jgi:hypothetical protein